jgi:hypothetical protein
MVNFIDSSGGEERNAPERTSAEGGKGLREEVAQVKSKDKSKDKGKGKSNSKSNRPTSAKQRQIWGTSSNTCNRPTLAKGRLGWGTVQTGDIPDRTDRGDS